MSNRICRDECVSDDLAFCGLSANIYGMKALRWLPLVAVLSATLSACTGGGHHAANRPTTSPGITRAPAVAYPAAGALLSTYFGPAATAQRIFGRVVNYPRVGHITPGELVVVTTGSGSCPTTPTAITVTGPTAVLITIGTPTNRPCTADLRITNNVITTPGLDTTRPVAVTLRLLPDGQTEAGSLPAV